MAILNDTSDHGPALVSFNDRLFIAWKGRGNYHLNVMSSADGVRWENKVVLNEFTRSEPALAVFNDRLYLGWTGTDDLSLLNVMATEDGVKWGDKNTILENSRFGPALCAFNGRLYMAWTGVDSLNRVNVLSSSDGKGWGAKATLAENSIATPALAAVAKPNSDQTDGSVLYLAWTGTDIRNHLNLIRSTDGVTFIDKMILNPDTLKGQDATSSSGPALSVQVAAAGDNPTMFPSLEIGWIEDGGDGHLRNLAYPRPNQDGSLIIDRPITHLADTSIAAPASAQFRQDQTYIAWTGTDEDHHLNVANVADLPMQ